MSQWQPLKCSRPIIRLNVKAIGDFISEILSLPCIKKLRSVKFDESCCEAYETWFHWKFDKQNTGYRWSTRKWFRDNYGLFQRQNDKQYMTKFREKIESMITKTLVTKFNKNSNGIHLIRNCLLQGVRMDELAGFLQGVPGLSFTDWVRITKKLRRWSNNKRNNQRPTRNEVTALKN